MPERQNLSEEIYRKILHIFYSLSIVLALWHLGKEVVLPWFIAISIILPLLDYGRRYIAVLDRIFIYLFSIYLARDGFEPSSQDPESHMIDRYTTGLYYINKYFINPSLNKDNRF